MKILQEFRYVIPANGEQSFTVSGASEYYLVSATADVRIQTDNGTPIGHPAKTGIQTAGQFSRLTVYNDTANPNTIVIICGFGGFIDNR